MVVCLLDLLFSHTELEENIMTSFEMSPSFFFSSCARFNYAFRAASLFLEIEPKKATVSIFSRRDLSE